MKTPFYVVLLIPLCIAAFTACNKSTDKPTPTQIDSLNAALPKEIITSYSNDSVGIPVPGSYVVSFKYDTTNRSIQLYYDDTTTANLYDTLGETFTYNSSGYLISVKESYVDGTQESDPQYNVTINRGTGNKISYIAEVSSDGSVYDSIFYNYQAVGGGMSITTINHYYEGPDLSGNDTSVYTFTSVFGLTGLAEPGYQTNTNYVLNSNGSIQSYATTSPDETTTANYIYASGLADGKPDAFTQALLGKDYYIYDLMNLDPFVYSYNASSAYDYFNIPFTDPYHISAANLQVTGSGGFSVTETANWTYQLNAQNNVVQVVFNNSENNTETVKIKY